jgi:hypothetical protein
VVHEPRDLRLGVTHGIRVAYQFAQPAPVLFQNAITQDGIRAQCHTEAPYRDTKIVQGLGVAAIGEPGCRSCRSIELVPRQHTRGFGRGTIEEVRREVGHYPRARS